MSSASFVVERLGAWLFRQRTWIPLPMLAALLLLPAETSPSLLLDAAGVALVAGGEAFRLWAVRHIGVISRTRSDRLGPVVVSGPFALVRNPLYLGNVAIWTGFALNARLPWAAPVIIVVLGLEYHAIVRWEEQILEARRGDEYRAYASRVPRWLPKLPSASSASPACSASSFSWRDTFFSERGTLIAIAVGSFLLWIKLKT